MSTRPAWLPAHEHWVPVSEAARVWGRSTRTIQLWCQDGTFASARVRIHFDSTARGDGQWWICLPPGITPAQSSQVVA